MVSAIVTAAGKNRRMITDQKSKGIEVKHKLLLDLYGKPVIIRTLENVLNSGVDEVVVVLGHFSSKIIGVIEDFDDERVKVVENPDVNVELSETVLNGVNNLRSGLCLCVAADQPTVTTETFKTLIKMALEYSEPENIISIMARHETGFLDSAKGLGMPFVCHTHLLKSYLPGREDNLNPILRDMIAEGVVFYGVPARNELELVNINRWDDYILVSENMDK
jgi:molybdenum cofactor cytidylyltransferase